MSYTTAAMARRLRGAIMNLTETHQSRPNSLMDSSAIASALVRGLGFAASQHDVRNALEDLCMRGYITYKEAKHKQDEAFGALLFEIRLTPKGRDLLEGTIEDPAVEI